MKKMANKSGLLALLLIIGQMLMAQENYSGWTLRESKDLTSIDNLEISGTSDLIVIPAISNRYELKTKKEGEYFTRIIQDGTKLTIKTDTKKKVFKKRNKNQEVVFLFLKESCLSKIDASGSVEIDMKGAVAKSTFLLKTSGATEIKIDTFDGTELKADWSGASTVNIGAIHAENMILNVSGATEAKILNIDCKEITSNLSGASDVQLQGKCDIHKATVSGASELDAKDLISGTINIEADGASHAEVNGKNVQKSKSGVSDIKLYGESSLSTPDGKEGKKEVVVSDNDSVTFRLGKFKVGVFEGADDSIHIDIDGVTLDMDGDGNVSIDHQAAEPKFDAHWNGFELGLNGYAKSRHEILPDFKPAEEYMDLNYGKSVVFNWNFLEQNLALISNKKLGLFTGLGLTWNNYRFTNNTRLDMVNNKLTGYRMEDISIRKTKLSVFSLRVPVMIEFQTNMEDHKKRNDFFVSAGIIGSVRINSHTKVYFNELNKDFTLSQYDPEAETYQPIGTVNSGSESKVKRFDSFHLNPFHLDATARIGWGRLKLFATYALTPMFRKDRGPVLYPWSLGIMLTN
jgi:hypothetical protein